MLFEPPAVLHPVPFSDDSKKEQQGRIRERFVEIDKKITKKN